MSSTRVSSEGGSGSTHRPGQQTGGPGTISVGTAPQHLKRERSSRADRLRSKRRLLNGTTHRNMTTRSLGAPNSAEKPQGRDRRKKVNFWAENSTERAPPRQRPRPGAPVRPPATHLIERLNHLHQHPLLARRHDSGSLNGRKADKKTPPAHLSDVTHRRAERNPEVVTTLVFSTKKERNKSR